MDQETIDLLTRCSAKAAPELIRPKTPEEIRILKQTYSEVKRSTYGFTIKMLTGQRQAAHKLRDLAYR